MEDYIISVDGVVCQIQHFMSDILIVANWERRVERNEKNEFSG